jgi:hypothetical protein
MICGVIVFIAVRSHQLSPRKLDIASRYFKSQHARYTLRSDSRGMTLYGPGAADASASAARARAATVVSRVRSSDINWELCRWKETKEKPTAEGTPPSP